MTLACFWHDAVRSSLPARMQGCSDVPIAGRSPRAARSSRFSWCLKALVLCHSTASNIGSVNGLKSCTECQGGKAASLASCSTSSSALQSLKRIEKTVPTSSCCFTSSAVSTTRQILNETTTLPIDREFKNSFRIL